MKDEITISKKEFEDLIRDVVTDNATQITTGISVQDGFKCTLFGAMVAHELVDRLFKNEDLEVEKNG